MRPRGPVTLRSRLATLGVSLAVALAIAEACLQVLAAVLDPEARIPPGTELPPPDPDSWRVIAVGDSWVAGAEAEAGSSFIDVFAEEVERETGRPVQVYNLGQSATNSSQALLRVVETVDWVRPDLVVALTGANNMLHDKGVEDAASVLGEDVRLSPAWRILGWSRVYRVARQVLIVLRTPERRPGAEAPTPDPVPDLLYGSGGADPGGRLGLPAPPPVLPAAAPHLEWSDLYFRRDFATGLAWVLATDPVDPASRAQRGVLKAWEALFLAHLERFEEAEAAARESLDLGGDAATAWEALAIAAELQDRPLVAAKHRIRAAEVDSPSDGYPWFAVRARGLVLLDLEAWEAAEAWLMAAQAEQPGNLEVLLGLSRLPSATRGARVGEVLAEGPRGKVSQIEYYRWHEVSSGMVDRMVASLGEPDPGEPASMAEGRGRSALAVGDAAAAERWFRAALSDPAAREIDRARARAGLVALSKDAASFEGLLGVPSGSMQVDPSNAAALVAFEAGQGLCDEAIRLGQEGLALGMSPQAFERAAGSCLSREVGWSLVETALGRGPVLDRAALVLGRAAGSLAGPLRAPDVPFWGAFRERRWDDVAALADGAWEGLALAHAGRPQEAAAILDEAEAAGGDAAVIGWGRALLAADAGDMTGSMLAAFASAGAGNGDPWVREVARGYLLARALKWRGCQAPLLAALRVAPGYLEALEILAEVPQPLRYPAAEVALRYVPSGSVAADRWSLWYLAQERFVEARLALLWPPGFLPEDPSSAARRALALGRIEEAQDNAEAARAAYAHAMDLAEALHSQPLYCRAAARRVRAAGKGVDDAELVLMNGACQGQADALDAAGRIAALRGRCDHVALYSRRAVMAGADPADVSEWMEPCAQGEEVDGWLRARPAVAEAALDLLLHRVHPGTEDELPPPGSAPGTDDLLVRELAAMDRIARASGARMIAMTYPFPGAHHQRLRDSLVAEAPRAGVSLLDCYGHFQDTFGEQDWQQMRTPQDHVDARGYREMGEELFREVRRRGWLPR